jgi:hypothetical protein
MSCRESRHEERQIKEISRVSTESGSWPPASHMAIQICVIARAEPSGAVPEISAGKRRAEKRLRILEICRFYESTSSGFVELIRSLFLHLYFSELQAYSYRIYPTSILFETGYTLYIRFGIKGKILEILKNTLI